jgi:two-component system phosphate regulon sensor histidine kinase PhoR
MSITLQPGMIEACLSSGYRASVPSLAPEAVAMQGTTVALVCVALVIGACCAVILERRRTARHANRIASELADLYKNAHPRICAHLPGEFHHLVAVIESVAREASVTIRHASRERERTVAVLSSMADGVVVLDANGKVAFVNKSQLDRLGMRLEQCVGRSFIEVVHDHEIDGLVRSCFSTGVVQRGVVETEPGRRILDVTVSPVVPDNGCLVVMQDLTELRRLEKVRSDFVANVSHELRTPLTSLKLLAETLSDSGVDDPAVRTDYTGRIEVEVDRLSQMVDELGELSMIETGRARIEFHSIDMRIPVMRALERLEPQSARAGVRMSATVPDDLPTVLADEYRIEQVLVSLLHNAIKFTPSGGRIVVEARVTAADVVVSVTDTGIGIPDEDLVRIFERFYKADKSRSSKGTGLGLSIARHVVRAHGGTIWAESEEGKGSTFSFSLPRDSVSAGD